MKHSQSPQTRLKISRTMKLRRATDLPSWNKGVKRDRSKTCEGCGTTFQALSSNRQRFCTKPCWLKQKAVLQQRRLEKTCRNCDNPFTVIRSSKKSFCTHKCWMQYKVKNKLALNTGFRHSEETKALLSGENSSNWKGDKVGYSALHTWVYKKLGKATHCSFNSMHEAKRFEWANRSKKYLRELTDWISLCPKCHANYDERKGNPTTYFKKGHPGYKANQGGGAFQ